MALIAFDATSSSGNLTATGATWSHTCTGNNQILYVGINVTNNTITVSNATYNSVAMTSLGSVGSGSGLTYLYYLLNPSSGTHNIVVGLSGSVNFVMYGSSYSNVSQSSFPDSSNTGSGITSPRTVSTTTVADNCWLICAGFALNASIAAGANTTLRQSSGIGFIGDSNASETPPGSFSQSITFSPGNSGMIVVSMTHVLQTLSLAADRGSFLLTGYTTFVSKLKNLTASVGVFILTRYAALFGRMSWHNTSKNSSTATDTSKNLVSISNTVSKNNSSWTDTSKSI